MKGIGNVEITSLITEYAHKRISNPYLGSLNDYLKAKSLEKYLNDQKAVCCNIDLTDQKLCGADFSEALFDESIFINTDLNGVVFFKTSINKANITNAKNLLPKQLSQAIFDELIVEESDKEKNKIIVEAALDHKKILLYEERDREHSALEACIRRIEENNIKNKRMSQIANDTKNSAKPEQVGISNAYISGQAKIGTALVTTTTKGSAKIDADAKIDHLTVVVHDAKEVSSAAKDAFLAIGCSREIDYDKSIALTAASMTTAKLSSVPCDNLIFSPSSPRGVGNTQITGGNIKQAKIQQASTIINYYPPSSFSFFKNQPRIILLTIIVATIVGATYKCTPQYIPDCRIM